MIKVYYTKIKELAEFCKAKQETDCKEDCICEKAMSDNLVNKQRRSKILRCKNKEDKLRSLMVGLLLRYALEQEGIDYEKAEFTYETHGKPILLQMKNAKKELFFNLSHCKNYVGCVISDKNIGIDLEESTRTLFLPEKEQQLLSMAKRICTKEEYTYILDLSKEERILAYLEIWTRKESFAKEDGRGIAIGLQNIQVLESKDFETKWITDEVCMSIYQKNMAETVCDYHCILYKELLPN